MREPKFNIGQQYKTRGKHPRVCTVIDIYTTYNYKGEIVKLRYVSQHEFCGQLVIDDDVLETTILRGMIK